MSDAAIEFQSQFGQDRYVDEHVFRGLRGGVFVDIGAHDGVSFSNTYALEKHRGWSGLLVEPIPARAEQCRRSRGATVAEGCVAPRSGTQTFTVVENFDMLSGLGEFFPSGHQDRIQREAGGSKVTEFVVQCFEFGDLMQRHGVTRIDFCSIDTEGSEFEILKTIDFARFRPRCFSIEENGKRFAIWWFLSRRGYRLVEFLGADMIFVTREQARAMPKIGFLARWEYVRRALQGVKIRLRRLGAKGRYASHHPER